MCRLGFIVDFLSHATIVGFMGGAATVVCLQQLKAILGLERFTHGADLVSGTLLPKLNQPTLGCWICRAFVNVAGLRYLWG